MKEFKPEDIDFITWAMKQADYDRAKRRSLINSLFNGTPPYTKEEQEESGITINVNDLSGPRAAHDARAQFTSAFMKPGAYFSAKTDTGRRDKRDGYSSIVTKEVAKVMKRSIAYTETHRSKWAMTVLHGIAPCIFPTRDIWRPRAVGIDDVMVPSNTELIDIAEGKMTIIPIYRSLNAHQLRCMAKGPVPDPGWNQPLVDQCLQWIDEQMLRVAGTNWQDVWSPEKWEERIKGDGSIYSSDAIPTINVWDFYYWSEGKDGPGWNRRMILDSWTMPNSPDGSRTRRDGKPFQSGRNQFLYNPGKRLFGTSQTQLINFQFADLSAVAPFHYHTVRSLGYLLYSVCHLQNRLRCKFSEAVFEQLMVLMRIRTQDDMQRALSVNLISRGFVDDSVEFIKAGDRYQVNTQLAQLALTENQNLISRNSSSFTSRAPSGGDAKVPTATQWMGEEARVTQLVSAGLMQAYEYQKPEYYEIFRRLTKKGSADADARRLQAKCLEAGVPEEVLYCLESWEIEPERVLGAGNKALEMAITQQLMAYRHLYDPPAQRKILYDTTLAITEDPARAETLVPEEPKISDSVHDAQVSVGTLLMGQPMAFRANANHGEYAEALISALELEVQKVMATGGVTTQEHIIGMQNLAGISLQGEPVPGNGAFPHIQAFLMDPSAKSDAKLLNDRLSKVMNEVRAMQQRLDEQQSQGNGQPGMSPEDIAKAQVQMMQAEQKMEERRRSHAERTAQRQIAFENEEARKNEATQAEIARENARFNQELTQEAVKNVTQLEQQKRSEKPQE